MGIQAVEKIWPLIGAAKLVAVIGKNPDVCLSLARDNPLRRSEWFARGARVVEKRSKLLKKRLPALSAVRTSLRFEPDNQPA